MDKDTTSRRRALVVGLGISGPASALRLHQAGWSVVVLEKAAERRRVGYFIALVGTGIAAAERLGISDLVPDRAAEDGVSYDIDRTGRRRPGMSYGALPGKSRLMTRGDVEEAVFTALPDEVEIRYATVPAATWAHPPASPAPTCSARCSNATPTTYPWRCGTGKSTCARSSTTTSRAA